MSIFVIKDMKENVLSLFNMYDNPRFIELRCYHLRQNEIWNLTTFNILNFVSTFD